MKGQNNPFPRALVLSEEPDRSRPVDRENARMMLDLGSYRVEHLKKEAKEAARLWAEGYADKLACEPSFVVSALEQSISAVENMPALMTDTTIRDELATLANALESLSEHAKRCLVTRMVPMVDNCFDGIVYDVDAKKGRVVEKTGVDLSLLVILHRMEECAAGWGVSGTVPAKKRAARLVYELIKYESNFGIKTSSTKGSFFFKLVQAGLNAIGYPCSDPSDLIKEVKRELRDD